MRRLFFLYLFYTICTVCIAQGNADNRFVVVIDAGHGGKDGGAVRGLNKEKDINLAVTLALGKQIESNMRDVKIVYTRKSDIFVDLYKRADIANKAKANLFISIHTNSTAAKVTNASGADTYILGLARSNENLEVAKRENSVIMLEDGYSKRYEGFDPNSPESNILFEFMTNKYMDQSLEFATFVQKGFSTIAKRVDRGVAQAGFLVLRESGMPSVLIELGFINNPNDAVFLTSSTGQEKMASAIYYGFKKYKDQFDKHQGGASYKKTESPDIEISDTITDTIITEPEVKVKPQKNKNKDKNKDKNKNNYTGPEYRVQFLISTKKLSANSKEFKGLSPVFFYYDNGVYKYTYGLSRTEAEAIKIARSIRKDFKDAFVIKFENGVRTK